MKKLDFFVFFLINSVSKKRIFIRKTFFGEYCIMSEITVRSEKKGVLGAFKEACANRDLFPTCDNIIDDGKYFFINFDSSDLAEVKRVKARFSTTYQSVEIVD